MPNRWFVRPFIRDVIASVKGFDAPNPEIGGNTAPPAVVSMISRTVRGLMTSLGPLC